MDTLKVCLLSFLIHAAYGAPADECPHNLGKSDLYTYGNFCLKVHYGNYDWVDARHQCKKEGGDLIQIRDSGMQQFLQRVLSGQRSEDTGFWIGASDSESESHWKWVAGDPKMAYSHWSSGQGPSQSGFLFADGGHEDCALMKIHDGFRWHDYECSLFLYHYSFICQHDKLVHLHTHHTNGQHGSTTVFIPQTFPDTTPLSTDAPIPTTPPDTDAPIPTTQPITDAPVPTTQPQTDAPIPTTQPITDAPVPTTQPQTDAPIPTTQPITDAPAPTTPPQTDAPVPTTPPDTQAPISTTGDSAGVLIIG